MILLPIFFIISLIYSSVGLGGGSAYVTALVLAGVPKETLPVISLGCNIVVAGLGFLQFKHAGHFRWRLFWPFAASSIPMAFLGGRLGVGERTLSALLAAALALAALRLLFFNRVSLSCRIKGDGRPHSFRGETILLIVIGAILGFVAGVTGIGGGIYLIPAILLLGLATPREAAAASTLFIVVNSASGLAGHLLKNPMNWAAFLPFAAVVFAGGLIGARWGATRLKGETIQKIVGAIMLIAVGKLVSHLF